MNRYGGARSKKGGGIGLLSVFGNNSSDRTGGGKRPSLRFEGVSCSAQVGAICMEGAEIASNADISYD